MIEVEGSRVNSRRSVSMTRLSPIQKAWFGRWMALATSVEKLINYEHMIQTLE